MVEGADWAFSNPDPAGLYAAGKRFGMRYIGPGTDDKHLHAAERDALWAAGLQICLLVEAGAQSALLGFAEGVREAQLALDAARALGAPDSLPMYCAVDFDVQPAQWNTVLAYFNGVATVIGSRRVGIYGGINAMRWAARDHAAVWFFQTYAWSSGQWFPGNHVEQYHNGVQLAGGEVDLCRAVQPQYGQWGPAATKEDDMLFAVKEANNGTVYLSNGMHRRVGISWAQFQQLSAMGWITTPAVAPPLSIASDGFVVVVPDGQIDAYAGPLETASSAAPPIDMAAIEAAAEKGAKEGIEGATIHAAG